ncbi:MAG: peptide chain release factor 3 [Alphaproteobacteria bacterium]
MATLAAEIDRRRTFAIIAHPDAGKTTLTEKLLLFGGAIQMAGAVKARGAQRRARSDWLKVERERGISVASSVMTFEYQDKAFNLLDTPGHEDFSEDTYRTLTAVDSAVMVLDAAKGIEPQTLKLFEVCRLRDIPIITFVNKMDREARDPFELIDQIQEKLALDVAPMSWPIGSGRDFKGCYDLQEDLLVLLERSREGMPEEGARVNGLDDPQLDALLPAHLVSELREQAEMARELCPAFDRESFLEGHMTPLFFGSAINNFGVRELLEGVASLAPSPRPQPAVERFVEPDEKKVSGFVFKIQANMDPNHRDRIAFVRLASGKFQRGMKLKHVRTGKTMAISAPVMFLAQDRELAEEAWPGDIVGLPNHGALRIGDSLTEGEAIRFTGVPDFAPELLQRVVPEDPMRAKHLSRALTQLAEEGVARAFKPFIGSYWIVGVVGALQFDVMADRIRSEYSVPVRFESAGLHTARWVAADDARTLKDFMDKNRGETGEDHDGAPVFLARNPWRLNNAEETFPDVRFLKTKDQTV